MQFCMTLSKQTRQYQAATGDMAQPTTVVLMFRTTHAFDQLPTFLLLSSQCGMDGCWLRGMMLTIAEQFSKDRADCDHPLVYFYVKKTCGLVCGFKHFYFPFHIWDVILPIDERIFFRGVGIPPTSG